MDLDLDLFERRRERRGRRRRHPHVFSWLVLAGGAVLLCAAAIALAASLGAWGALSDAYFAATTAVMPAAWHDEWLALPGWAHVGIALGALFVLTGLLGEVFD